MTDIGRIIEGLRTAALDNARAAFYPDGPVVITGGNYLYDFVKESNLIEGIQRDPTLPEVQAHLDLISGDDISADKLKAFVDVIQPGAKLRMGTNMNVRVGAHRPISGGPQVMIQLNEILSDIRTSHPFEIYCRYETLHPFMDGNGRSGRALWLGMMIQKLGELPRSFLKTFHYQALAMHDRRQKLRDSTAN